MKLRWTVFPLHPETPDEGRSLEDLFAGRMDVPKAMSELREIAADLGLPFGNRTHTYNSRRAQELGKWAEQQGKGDAFRSVVFRAYFADGWNIAEPDIIVGLCESIGLDRDEAHSVLEEKRFVAAVDADWQRVADVGIRSVPTRIYHDRILIGYRPAFELISLIESMN